MDSRNDPAVLLSAFEWVESFKTLPPGGQAKLLGNNNNRVAVVFSVQNGDTVSVWFTKNAGVLGGYKLTTAQPYREFFYKDWGALVGREFWGTDFGFFGQDVVIMELIYRPSLLGPNGKPLDVLSRHQNRNGNSDVSQIGRVERSQSTDRQSIAQQERIDFLATFVGNDVPEL